MSPDLVFWLALATKLLITAGFVVLASWAAERAGPLMAAMVVTLPVAAGPTYVFLALDHDAAFIAASALTSLVSNAATVLFCAVYSLLAQSRGRMVSLALALAIWIGFVTLLKPVGGSLAAAFTLSLAVFVVCLPIGWRLRHAPVPRPVRRWYDVPLRAGMVAGLVGTVVSLSSALGPATTGILALVPIVLISLILILHPRLGGPATAAITANSIPGLAGFCLALVALHEAAPLTGKAAALAAALAVSMGWNLMLFGVSRYARARAVRASA
jgi:hypothetical protein